MFENFTDHAKEAVENAAGIASELSHNYIGTEHLLIGLLSAPGVAGRVLEENGVEKERLLDLIQQLIAPATNVGTAERDNFTPRSQRILGQSYREARRLGSEAVGTEHILIALIKEADCIAVRLLNTLGVNVQKLYVDLMTAVGQDVGSAKNEYMANKGRGRNKSATPTLTSTAGI